ncbi:hypothetical protein [Paenibacillus donghaensis]|nr:hypothetical protein [Paenibacillus donghaensis]
MKRPVLLFAQRQTWLLAEAKPMVELRKLMLERRQPDAGVEMVLMLD